MTELKFSISKEAYDLLVQMSKGGLFEYRDFQYDSFEEYKGSYGYVGGMTEELFLSRNCNGTSKLIKELQTYSLVECDDDAWHPTFHITEFGKQILTENKFVL